MAPSLATLAALARPWRSPKRAATRRGAARNAADEEAAREPLTAAQSGMEAPPPNWDAEVAARLCYWACGIAYAEFAIDSTHWHGWNDEAGMGKMEKRLLVHRSHELMLLYEKETGSVYVIYRGTTTTKDALRDATFVAVDPMAHTAVHGRGLDSHSCGSAIASCLGPKRACYPRMHLGFLTRSHVHNPFLLMALF